MIRGSFTSEQTNALLGGIKRSRVYQSQGMSHVAAHDVTAHLTRMFGFDGWDKQIVDLTVVREHHGHDTKTDKTGWYVTYRCVMRLTIYNPDGQVTKIIEEAATGTASNQPEYGDAHDFACKNAISYALKRCAKDLGDQFGLSLYEKNWERKHDKTDPSRLAPFVGKLVTADTNGHVDDHVTVEGEEQ